MRVMTSRWRRLAAVAAVTSLPQPAGGHRHPAVGVVRVARLEDGGRQAAKRVAEDDASPRQGQRHRVALTTTRGTRLAGCRQRPIGWLQAAPDWLGCSTARDLSGYVLYQQNVLI